MKMKKEKRESTTIYTLLYIYARKGRESKGRMRKDEGDREGSTREWKGNIKKTFLLFYLKKKY